MRLRTRLNLVVAALSAAFVIVLIAAEFQSTRTSVREEIEAANRVASQLLGRLAAVYSRVGGPDLRAYHRPSLQALGRCLRRLLDGVLCLVLDALNRKPMHWKFPLDMDI